MDGAPPSPPSRTAVMVPRMSGSLVEVGQAEITTRTSELKELIKPLQAKVGRRLGEGWAKVGRKMAEIEHLTEEDERCGKFRVE